MSSSSSPTRPGEAPPQQAPTLAPIAPAGNEDQTKEIAPFLRSLRRMLDRESDAILCWTPDGRAFEIHDMEVMTSYILPKYFKHAKYTSFQRQLNYFNFRKWTKSRAVVCTFSNAFFVRDQPDLTWRITRKRGLSESKSASHNNSGSNDGGASPSPRSPKPRTPSTAGVAAGAGAGAVPKPVALKRETSGSKRKAAGAPSSARKVAKVAAAKPEAVSSADAGVESLEWVDTLYPSLEALEAECSVSASPAVVSPVASPLDASDINITSIVVPAPALESGFQYGTPSLESAGSGAYSNYSSYDGSGSYYGEQVAYSWPQYSPSIEDGARFRPAASYFAPTVVQTSCVAL